MWNACDAAEAGNPMAKAPRGTLDASSGEPLEQFRLSLELVKAKIGGP